MKAQRACKVCGSIEIVSKTIGVCLGCLRERPDEAVAVAEMGHAYSRKLFNLPVKPPKTAGGIPCKLCAAECVMADGEMGYCGIRGNRKGRMFSLTPPDSGLLHYYLDPHITNCCNAYFCPAATGCGYPRYAYRRGAETGYYNLALFFYGCSLNCLFCQNWSHKRLAEAPTVDAQELVNVTLSNQLISCWCWFGGSAEPQLPFAIKASRLIAESKPSDRIVRICYEWNGDGDPALVKRAVETVVETGGNVKFDLKAFNPAVHKALTGMDNGRILQNFEMVYRLFYDSRSDCPVLAATTLLVPGYVDAEEVERIAEFIAGLDDRIPYSLLVFHPDFMLNDMPITPFKQVAECHRAALKHLQKVHLGNLHLLQKM
ncbi:MAG: radical SAM protein [Candidatus Caldarchaeum sp.]